MKKLFGLVFFYSLIIIAFFMIFSSFESFSLHKLNTQQSKGMFALISSVLLISDIVMPIPSSVIMLLNGKMLGVFAGSIISFFAGIISSTIGYFLGKASQGWTDKLFTKDGTLQGKIYLEKYGSIAIVTSKALPILSEVVCIVAGTMKMKFRTFLLYSIVGHFVVSVFYAAIGSYASSLDSNVAAGLVIGSALLVAWIFQILVSPKLETTQDLG